MKGKKKALEGKKKLREKNKEDSQSMHTSTQLINERMGKKKSDRSLLERGGSNLEWPSMAWV